MSTMAGDEKQQQQHEVERLEGEDRPDNKVLEGAEDVEQELSGDDDGRGEGRRYRR